MKGAFIGNRPEPVFGFNTALTPPTQPCLDESNSYHSLVLDAGLEDTMRTLNVPERYWH